MKSMMSLTVDEIVRATRGKPFGEKSTTFSGVSIDSRTIVEGEVFFALRGDRFDGHDFVDVALSAGGGAVVEQEPDTMKKGKVIIRVEDTLRALQDLAKYVRSKHDIPVIAITGSNGKTTTKEMAYAILSRRYKVLKNLGNLNNHIGLPLSLTRLEPSDEVVVLELGMNSTGEIRKLCEIALPSHGIITNIGSAHIGRLGSPEAVRRAKLEMLDSITTAVLNGDDDFLMSGVKGFKGNIITFSIKRDSYVMAKNLYATESGNGFKLVIRDGGSVEVQLNVRGIFNVYNALAASAVCFSLGMTAEDIKTALEEYTAFPMRFEVIRRGGITLINDAYNANPSSVREAVGELIHMGAGGRTVAIMGDMGELGDFSEHAHRDVIKWVLELGVDVLVTVGEMMSRAAKEAESWQDGATTVIHRFGDIDECTESMTHIVKQDDIVLVKGSRMMHMERVAKVIGNAI